MHHHYSLSACPAAYFFEYASTNSQAQFPCSQLDGSFPPYGKVTANCSTANSWGPLDMSQCTFRNDVPVAAVAVVEVASYSAIQTTVIEVLYIYSFYIIIKSSLTIKQ